MKVAACLALVASASAFAPEVRYIFGPLFIAGNE